MQAVGFAQAVYFQPADDSAGRNSWTVHEESTSSAADSCDRRRRRRRATDTSADTSNGRTTRESRGWCSDDWRKVVAAWFTMSYESSKSIATGWLPKMNRSSIRNFGSGELYLDRSETMRDDFPRETNGWTLKYIKKINIRWRY